MKITKGIMITQKQLETHDLTHRHAGNGYAMVQDLDSEYCRISLYGKNLGSRAHLAAKSQLEITRRPIEADGPVVDIKIPAEILEPLQKLRDEIRCGNLVIVQTHIKKP